MKIEDCYVGQTVKHNYTDMYLDIEEGDKGIIEEVNKKDNYIVVWGKQFDPSNFSAYDKFNINDEVIYKSFDSETIKSREKAVIFGIAPKRDKFKKEYAISYIHEGPYGKKKRVNEIVAEHKLSPLKKPDELETGDKFKLYDDNKVLEVLNRNYDTHHNQIVYTAKVVGGIYDGEINSFLSSYVDEIIYD
jgi:hypothetical protein